MKTSVAKAVPVFEPVVVTITLESEQELKMLHKMSGKNKTVACVVAENAVCSTEDVHALADMLADMYDVLKPWVVHK